MVRMIMALLALIVALTPPALAADGDRHAFVIKQFMLENGTLLPEAKDDVRDLRHP